MSQIFPVAGGDCTPVESDGDSLDDITVMHISISYAHPAMGGGVILENQSGKIQKDCI